MVKQVSEKSWSREQRDYWTRVWQDHEYTMEDYLDGDKWVGVKFSPILPLILQHVPKAARILEAGCGLGQWVIYLANLGYDITGLDFSQETIARLRREYPKYHFVVGDVTDFDYPEASFDCILSWGVVEHFEAGPQQALAQSFRILRQNGLLFVTVPCQSYLYRILAPVRKTRKWLAHNALLRKMLNKPQSHDKFFQYEFKPSVFQGFLQDAGFDVLLSHPISQERGFAKQINEAFNFGRQKSFHKNKNGRWQGLSRTGGVICKTLNILSPWYTPDFMLFIAKKQTNSSKLLKTP